MKIASMSGKKENYKSLFALLSVIISNLISFIQNFVNLVSIGLLQSEPCPSFFWVPEVFNNLLELLFIPQDTFQIHVNLFVEWLTILVELYLVTPPTIFLSDSFGDWSNPASILGASNRDRYELVYLVNLL